MITRAGIAVAALMVLLLSACVSMTSRVNGSDVQALFEQLRARLIALQERGIARDSYAMAKAHAWLDLAFDAHVQRDTSSMRATALQQSSHLIEIMERSEGLGELVTDRIVEADSLRADLWARAEQFKAHANLACAAGNVARLEVQLLAAGHANQVLGWRHARAYLQAAERYAERTQRLLQNCADVDAASDANVEVDTPQTSTDDAVIIEAPDSELPTNPLQ